jgi:DNA ligase (NAD+)
MGEAVVSQLVQLKLVKNFADIYKLTSADLSSLELFKDKKVNNLLVAIKKSKKQPLSRLIYALGIRHVGEKAAYVLAEKFRHLDNLIKAEKEELDAIYEVGSVMAESIVDFFAQESTRGLLKNLRETGLNLKEELTPAKKNALTGKTLVFTGELKNFSRNEVQRIVRQLGANASSSVSKNTDFVVAGQNPGSKYNTAKKLGVKIINEDEFRGLIK